MKRPRPFFFILAGMLLFSRAFSQTAGLSIQLLPGDSLPGSTNFGTSYPINVWIINVDTASFNGHIDFAYARDTSIFTGSNAVSGVEYNDTNQIHLGSGDTVMMAFVVHISSPVFTSGPSVVVIWPYAIGAVARDSIVISTTVTDTALGVGGIGDKRLELFIAGDGLHIEKDVEIQLKQVRILDITGGIITDQTNPSDNIPLPEMNTGIYFAEITYNQNLRKVFRFYR